MTSIKIIVTSGYPQIDIRMPQVEARFLRKPDDTTTVIEYIHELMAA